MSKQWEFSPEVIKKAQRYVADNHVAIDPGREGVYWVTGSRSDGAAYRVTTDAADGKVTWIGCTCPHGKNTGAGVARCSHAVAVLMTIRDSASKP